MSLTTAAGFAVAAWTLNEVSGSRADSVGSSTLTDNGSVGSAAGKFGNAADFGTSSSTKYLSCADNAALSTGDVDFTVRAWVKLTATSKAYAAVLGKADLSDNVEYQLYYRPGNNAMEWNFNNVVLRATNFGTLSTGTWYLVHAWHDSVNHLTGVTVNAATANTTADSGGVDRPYGFAIGTLGQYVDSDSVWDGLIDDVVILKGYVMTAQDRTDDYNSGTGVAFANWTGGGGGVIQQPYYPLLLGGIGGPF